MTICPSHYRFRYVRHLTASRKSELSIIDNWSFRAFTQYTHAVTHSKKYLGMAFFYQTWAQGVAGTPGQSRNTGAKRISNWSLEAHFTVVQYQLQLGWWPMGSWWPTPKASEHQNNVIVAATENEEQILHTRKVVGREIAQLEFFT